MKLWSVSGGWTQSTLTARDAPTSDALLTRQPAGVGAAATSLPVPSSRLLVRGPVAFAVTAFLGAPDALRRERTLPVVAGGLALSGHTVSNQVELEGGHAS